MNTTTQHSAILLMESHGLAPNVRSTSFASIKVWSKLYQAGSYFVDLSLQPAERGLGLRGEILTQTEASTTSAGTVTLLDLRGDVIATTTVGGLHDDGTDFLFEIEHADDYRLEIAFDHEILSIADLEVR